MKYLRYAAFSLPAVVAAALAAISVAVRYGAPEQTYSSLPMIILWALTALVALAYIIAARLFRRPATAGIHLSLLIILLGALATWLGASSGTLSISDKNPAASFTDSDGGSHSLPQPVTLRKLSTVTYPGTSAAADYLLTVSSADGLQTISMNHPGNIDGYRLFLKTIDPQSGSATLAVTHDPAGTAISYTGYLLLLISFLLFLLTPQRRKRKAVGLAAPLLLFLAIIPARASAAPRTAPDDLRRYMGHICVYNNQRIVPLSTLMHDFTLNLTGKPSFDGHSADEIFTGFLFYFGDWKSRPVIRVKSAETKRILGIEGSHASYLDFFNAVASGALAIDNPASLPPDVRLDVARFESVNSLVSGSLLRLFPVKTDKGATVWLSPADDTPVNLSTELWTFIRKSPGLLNEYVQTRRYGDAADLLDAIEQYQAKALPADALPSRAERRLEAFYTSHLRQCMVPGIVIVVAGILLLAFGSSHIAGLIGAALSILLLAYTTMLLALRWIITGHIPLADGYETMQFMAWAASVGALIFVFLRKGARRPTASRALILVAGLALMVAGMSGGSAPVTPLMPVLASPMLSIHVILVMLAYTLLALLAILSIRALITSEADVTADVEKLLAWAVFLLAAGIFTGAIWANQSWGRYWGWDPKEVWALITLLIYSYPLHRRSLPDFRRSRFMHIYLTVAFLSVLFTYFGVNYLLGGLHSYA